MNRLLAGEGTVRCDTPGGSLTLVADGASWSLVCAGREAALALWRGLAALPAGRRRLGLRAGHELARVGLRLEVRCGDRMLAVLGTGSRPARWSRWWTGGDVELHWRELLRLAFGR